VVRKALQDSKKAALGKIAFGGREHLIAISAPEDDKQLGMMAYTLRYSEELRDPADYFADIKPMKVDEDQLALAKELIQRKTSSFAPEQFTDDYESALRAMVQAKIKHLPLPEEKDSPKPTKVINLMDALRKSISGTGSSNAAKAGKKTAASGTRRPPRENKLTLVTPSKKASTKPSKPTKKRRSA
jgi:DNA end-binding protein Ku